ncbi:MAG: hypothetical protein HQ559_11270 [Lentisphaerae bacterium]|nr:hypothetical protein [Lentisphaerota bacterium]
MRYLAILLGIVLAVTPAAGADKEEMARDAQGALKTMRSLVTEQTYKLLGFDSPGEAETAKLGEPMQVFMVRLDDLREYKDGADVGDMLRGGDEYIFPVEVNRKTRASIVMMGKDRMKAVAFGWPNRTRLLTEYRGMVAERAKVSPSSIFVVRIPALNRYFVAFEDEEGMLMMAPILDDAGLGVKAGEILSADRIFEALLPEAYGHDGLPH